MSRAADARLAPMPLAVSRTGGILRAGVCDACAGRAGEPSQVQSIPAPSLQPLRDAYEAQGGLASADDLVRTLRAHAAQPISRLARWLVARELVCWVEGGRSWIPLFQFVPADMTPRADVARVLGELRCTFDDTELATWFVAPNLWLAKATPLERLRADLPGVLAAARADRYVARG